MRTRTRGKILLRNCARRSKVSKPLMSEGVGELKWACPLCSTIEFWTGILFGGNCYEANTKRE